MIDYPIIELPMNPSFREVPSREIRQYFEWFLGQIPIRIGLLERLIIRDIDSKWMATYDRESLIAVSEFLEINTETRERTLEESGAPARGQYVPDRPDRELTNATFSLAIDVAMYFGETMRRSGTAASWGLSLKNKAFADYGHPLLVRGAETVNPVRLMVNLAYGFADGTHNKSRLIELFDYWFSIVNKE